MNRREFAKVFSAIAAGFTVNGLLIPGRQQSIDLNWFCENDTIYRFDLRKPFHQKECWFATDARICLRVQSAVADNPADDVRLPNAAGLSWSQLETSTNWKPWPKIDRFNYTYPGDSTIQCFECRGLGVVAPPNQVPACDYCDGEKQIWVDEYNSVGICPKCVGRGNLAKWLPTCQLCGGLGEISDSFDNVQVVGGSVVNAWYDNLVRQLDCVEFLDVERDRLDPVGFRFNGGLGLLMPMDVKRS